MVIKVKKTKTEKTGEQFRLLYKLEESTKKRQKADMKQLAS